LDRQLPVWRSSPPSAAFGDDIVRDLQEVIVSLCARLYGKRAAKNRAKKAIEAIQCA